MFEGEFGEEDEGGHGEGTGEDLEVFFGVDEFVGAEGRFDSDHVEEELDETGEGEAEDDATDLEVEVDTEEKT